MIKILPQMFLKTQEKPRIHYSNLHLDPVTFTSPTLLPQIWQGSSNSTRHLTWGNWVQFCPCLWSSLADTHILVTVTWSLRLPHSFTTSTRSFNQSSTLQYIWTQCCEWKLEKETRHMLNWKTCHTTQVIPLLFRHTIVQLLFFPVTTCLFRREALDYFGAYLQVLFISWSQHCFNSSFSGFIKYTIIL